MSVNLSPVAGAAAQFLDNSGNVLTGGKLYTYAAGTTTPQATYTSGAGVTFHSNPIILDAAGRVPAGGEIWLTDGISYKFVLKDANDVLIGTWDNLIGINSNFLNYYTQEETQTATQGQTIFTLATLTYTPGTNSLSVYVNGSKQIVDDNYYETDATTVTFASGLNVGDVVDFTTAVTLSSGVTDASLVTYDPPYTASTPTTVELKLAQTVSIKDFGAVGNGTVDDTVAIQNALLASKDVIVPIGTYLISSTINVPQHAKLTFQGGLGNVGGGNPTAYFIKKSTMTTVGITVSACGVIEGGGLVCQVGNTGDGIQLIGNSAKLSNVFVSYAGGVGVRVGTDSVYANTNSCELYHVSSFSNGSHGIYIHDNVSVNSADANAITVYQCTANSNAGDGIRLGHAFWVTVINGLAEGNTGWGLYLSGINNDSYPECRYANIVGGDYNEGNVTGQVYDASYFSNFFNADSNSIPTTASTGLQGSGFRNAISPRQNLLQGLTVNSNITGGGTAQLIVDNGTTSSAGSLNTLILQGKTASNNGDGLGILWNLGAGAGSYVNAGSINAYQATTDQYSMSFNVYKSGVLPALVINANANSVQPAADNAWNLGTSSNRWATVYAANGTINTSDANQKTDIVDISDVEKRVAVKLKFSMKRFKFKEGKRYHFGTIAQDVKAAFESEGLVAEEYGVFCADTLEDGSILLGIRYDELFAFIISSI